MDEQKKEWIVEWILPNGEVKQGAGIYDSVEEAQADVRAIIRTCQQWSKQYRIVERKKE